MAKKETKTASAAPVAAKVVNYELVGAMQQRIKDQVVELLASGVKLAVEEGSTLASETAPGHGRLALEIALPTELMDRINEVFSKEAGQHGLARASTKMLGRVTFEFATAENGKAADRTAIDWNRLAGHVPADDNDYNFAMLRKEWLGQSFVYAMNEFGDYWYTIVGLNPDANKPVCVICNDKADNDGTVWKLEAELVAEHVKKMAGRKIGPELTARKPDNCVIAKWVEPKKAAAAAAAPAQAHTEESKVA
jgi:hypothetical protein